MGDFFLNRDYIAKNLCVNRFDAIPICKGSCYLENKLKQDQERQEKTAPELTKAKEVLLYAQPLAPFTLATAEFTLESNKKESLYLVFYPSGTKHPIFHPPASIA